MRVVATMYIFLEAHDIKLIASLAGWRELAGVEAGERSRRFGRAGWLAGHPFPKAALFTYMQHPDYSLTPAAAFFTSTSRATALLHSICPLQARAGESSAEANLLPLLPRALWTSRARASSQLQLLFLA